MGEMMKCWQVFFLFITSFQDIDDHLVLAEALYRGIMELPEAYAITVAEEDVDK